MFLAVRPIQDHHWVVSITLIVLMFLVAVKWNKTTYFYSYLNSLFTSAFYSKKFVEKRRIELTEVILFVASLIGISFFLFVSLNGNSFSILTYLQIFFLVTIVLLSKYLIEKIIGDLFELDQLIGRYLFYKQGVLSWISLFLLFPVGLYLYFQETDNNILILIVIGVAVLIYTIKLFSFIGLYQKHILTYWFYFILYLCAFEIAPYLILFKVVKIN
ncbi:DUF4271 domain-containing protein [Psychroflexus sp. CCL10W]|nr:DUF4271 domain-containing protein [Psychroflexus montanilacus]